MVRNFTKRKKPNSGEQFAVNKGVLLQHFNLSRNKCLRTLEITAESIVAAKDTASEFLKTVLSTVTSPAPINVVIIYRNDDLGGVKCCVVCGPEVICFRHYTILMNEMACCHQTQLGIFRRMHSAWNFRLVLCADVSDCMVDYGIRTLKDIAKASQLPLDPLIISERRMLHTRSSDRNAGWSGRWPVRASAL